MLSGSKVCRLPSSLVVDESHPDRAWMYRPDEIPNGPDYSAIACFVYWGISKKIAPSVFKYEGCRLHKNFRLSETQALSVAEIFTHFLTRGKDSVDYIAIAFLTDGAVSWARRADRSDMNLSYAKHIIGGGSHEPRVQGIFGFRPFG